MPTDPDLPLVQQAMAGDAQAYGGLVRRYQRRVERLIGRMVRDVDLVPDIAQETFLRAYRALPRFRGEARFYTWLYRIAVNTTRKTLGALRRDPLAQGIASAGEPHDGTWPAGGPPTTETPEAALAAKEVARAVDQALAALPEDLRRAVTLREIDGLSYEAIASQMRCPIGTVRSRIFRAREAIALRVQPLLAHRSGRRW